MRLLIIALSLLSFLPLQSQKLWTLSECIQKAFDENLDVQLSNSNEELASIDLKTSKHAMYPTLNGNTGYNINLGRTIDPVTNAFVSTNFSSNSLSLSSGVLLYNFGRLRKAIKQSETNLKISELNTESVKRNVALNVAQLYINALLAKNSLEISQYQQELLDDQYGQLKKRIDAGLIPANDAFEIEAQIASGLQTIIEAENRYQLAILNLKQAVRIPVEDDIDIAEPGSLVLISDPDELTFEEVYAAAQQYDPSIESSLLNIENADQGIAIAETGLYPRLSLGGQLGTNYSNQAKRVTGMAVVTNEQNVIINGQPSVLTLSQPISTFENNPYFNQLEENLSYGVGLQLSIPIYNNYSVKGNIERAKVQRMNADLNHQKNIDQLKVNVQQTLANAKAAKRQYEASKLVSKTRKAAYDNAEKKYKLGNINAFELTTTSNNHQQAQINELLAKYNYYLAIKTLDFYMGKELFEN